MVSRYLAQLGWEWIFLDLQHGPLDAQTACECIHAIRAAGARPFVRVPIGAAADVSRFLDFGAQGIVVPMVNSAAEARAMARAAKYPPLGDRSIGGDVRHHYGEDYPERANRETLLLVQIEHIRAVKSAQAILSVEGVDGCFLGPTDLALSMGLPRTDYESHPRHRAAIERTRDLCRRLNKLACCNTYSLEDARAKARRGFDCITLESDVRLFLGSAAWLREELRQAVL